MQNLILRNLMMALSQTLKKKKKKKKKARFLSTSSFFDNEKYDELTKSKLNKKSSDGSSNKKSGYFYSLEDLSFIRSLTKLMLLVFIKINMLKRGQTSNATKI